MARFRSRSFGLTPRRNARRGRRISRRNAWTEAKTMVVKKAPRHSKVARDAWTPARKAAARKSRKYKGTYGKAVKPKASRKAKAKAAPKKSKGSRTPKAKMSSRASPVSTSKKRGKKPGKKGKTKRNGGMSRRRRSRHNPRRRSRRNARRSHRRNARRGYRRNGYMDLLPKLAGVGVGIAAAAWGASQLVGYLSKPDAQGKTMIPDSLKEYAPALLTGGVAAAAVWALKKFGGAKGAAYVTPVMFGGMAAALFQLAANVRIADAKALAAGQAGTDGKISLAQYLGLPFTAAPTPAVKAVSGYGVFGMGNVGNYGMFGLNGYTDVGGMVNTPGGPLAVEGVISIPGGGPLAVEGASFGGYLGGTLSDSVLGNQSLGQAPNPFAPGLREGNRGTMNEPHAAEVADAGSLSGNIFS